MHATFLLVGVGLRDCFNTLTKSWFLQLTKGHNGVRFAMEDVDVVVPHVLHGVDEPGLGEAVNLVRLVSLGEAGGGQVGEAGKHSHAGYLETEGNKSALFCLVIPLSQRKPHGTAWRKLPLKRTH